MRKHFLLVVATLILLAAPFVVGAANEVTLNNVVNFSLDTLEAVPTIITAGSAILPSQQVTNLDVHSNYIDISLDNLSDITFNTTVGGQYLKITPTSGPNFIATPTCITNTVTLTGTGATTIVRLEVTSTAPVCLAAGITVSAISGNTTESGATATFTVVLNSAPTANVTIGISSSDLTEGTVLPASLTFTSINWSTSQTVTVTGVDDAIVDGNITYTIITAAAVSVDLNYNGINPTDVTVVNLDNDSGGGGGGGGGTTYPSNYSLLINNGATCTTSNAVSLNLQALNTNQYEVSNNSNFTGATWQTYTGAANISWNLEAGDGTRTVYGLLKSSTGGLSPLISASINVNSAGCIAVPPVPPSGQCTIDCSKISYDLYIVNPDGTERHMNTNYVRAKNIATGIIQYSFEDKVDFNYIDVVIKVDHSVCGTISVQLISKKSAWNHQIKIKLLSGGIVQTDLVLWPNDAQVVPGTIQTLKLADYPELCSGNDIILTAGDLIKLAGVDTVYYYGSDGKRHTFPSRGTYDSWYNGDFSKVKIISAAQLSGLALGYNMTYKPGVRMLKIQSMPDVYAVDVNATLRLVTSEAVAQALYGVNWNKYIDDLSPAFYMDYTIGLPINQASDFPADLLPAQANSVIPPVPGITPMGVTLNPGDLIKGSTDTVYYYGADGKRHTFPSRGTYDSWYNGDFSKVKIISAAQLSGLALGYNMTYKPGVRMLKIQSMPDVYAVDVNATLRLVTSEAVAQALYGVNWNKFIDDLSPAFYMDYIIGLPINQASDFPAYLLPAQPNPVIPQAQCHAPITFTQDLVKGSSGQEVLELQKLLQCLGYFPANIVANGNFGPATHDAVVKFQQAHDLLAQGRVGPQTRALLNNL